MFNFFDLLVKNLNLVFFWLLKQFAGSDGDVGFRSLELGPECLVHRVP